MIKTTIICVGVVLLVLAALPFGANAAEITVIDHSQMSETRIIKVSGHSSGNAKNRLRYTTISTGGNMHGVDNNGNTWQFDAKTGQYHNFGTGVVCLSQSGLNCGDVSRLKAVSIKINQR